MILTLTWKELREHQGIWLTMAIMTVFAAWGLPLLVAVGDPGLGTNVAALTLLGLAATYGVVSGSMMFAGEHEGGTLAFLDIFHGRRGLLWLAKFAIGFLLVVAQAVAVALAFGMVSQDPPRWASAIVGLNARHWTTNVWLLILPVVSLQAYAWGLLGSSLTRRVLAGAAVAAVGVTPVWLFAILTSPPIFFILQIGVALIVLAISYACFVYQSREASAASELAPEAPLDSKEQFLEQWEEFERDNAVRDRSAPDAPVIVQTAPVAAPPHPTPREVAPGERPAARVPSPFEVLWWLTIKQALPVLWILGPVCLLLGVLMPANAQVLWPLATMMLGVVCGTAAFAPEQRDLSYQFLSAQHFPLLAIWRFKALFWLVVAVLGTLVLLFGHFLGIAARDAVLGPPNPPAAFAGTVVDRLGPLAFYVIWLTYGFGTGQVIVWLCRKSILALLVSSLVGACALGLWLPTQICGGMTGWQLWAPPLIMVSASAGLMRAWASGRIYERKPMAALIGFGTLAVIWLCMNLVYRAFEVPDVGQPFEALEFRAALPKGKDNAGGSAVNDAIGYWEDRDDRWAGPIAELPHLPVGMIEPPRATIKDAPILRHLPGCREIAAELLRRAKANEPGPALEHLAQILALSRNMRFKASFEAYLAGVEVENDAIKGLDQWLARGKPDPKLLRQVLDELTRHAAETPPALDCLRTECFRSGGFLLSPTDLVLPAPGEPGKVPERWLTGTVAFSLEVPWEAERNARIWQLVWAGLFRGIETQHWQLPAPHEVATKNATAAKILRAWIPAADGPGASVDNQHMVRLLEDSWLADDRLFCSVVRLREASTRSRCRVDATRLAIALSLYHVEEGKAASDLRDLAPKYFPAGLPIDPYSGQSYHYSDGNIWSTGPDRSDDGGRRDGSPLADDDGQWAGGGLDLITPVPHWP